jgi:hypothetical protein
MKGQETPVPLKKQNVIVEAMVPVPADEGAHPEHPIYIPVTPPPDSGLSPEHPIYIPVPPPTVDNSLPPYPDNTLPGSQPSPEHPIYLPITPPPDSGLSPEHPIYIPVYPDNSLPPYPDHPIQLPPPDLTEDQKQKIKEFLFGNLPPYESVQPVQSQRSGRR